MSKADRTAAKEQQWWRGGVIYQIYPRSFQDSGADGVGDLRGVVSRLDYLVELGIDAIWLSPFFPSPMADFGYDVADYMGVDPLFGTLDDFDALLEAAHARGLKVILDLVPNHTSNQHPWFLESRSSRTNAKRDWYLWRDPGTEGDAVPGAPALPNNWQSNFGGPAWTLDAPTGQFYYHSFLPEQPDLNWRNPDVRAGVYGAMRFWLERGVDGFRVDVIWMLIKDDLFRDNPVANDGSQVPLYTQDRPETLEIVREMRQLLESFGADRVLIGEIYLPIERLVAYYGAAASTPDLVATPQFEGAQMPFNFHLILTAWDAGRIARLIRDYEAALPAGAWPNWVLGNHDQHRIVTRIGAEQARVAAVLLLTLRGTPTLYNGDELGMPDARIAPEEVVDPAEKRQPGRDLGRDPERSPMLWENRENAGFCPAGVSTWLPLVWNWPRYTVESLGYDPYSMLALYRQLLQLRRARRALCLGEVEQVNAAEGVLSYVRVADSERILVLLNLTPEPRWAECSPGRLLLSSHLDVEEGRWLEGSVQLRPDEAFVVALDARTQG